MLDFNLYFAWFADHSPTYLLDLVPIDPNSITKSCLQDRLRLYQSFLRFSSLCCHSGSYYFRNPRIDIDKRRQLVSHSFRHFPILYLWNENIAYICIVIENRQPINSKRFPWNMSTVVTYCCCFFYSMKTTPTLGSTIYYTIASFF